MEKESVPNEKETQRLLRIFDESLATLTPEDVTVTSACPDSETFALYMEDEVDEKTREEINGHIAVCDTCYEEYVALVGPQKIMVRIDAKLAQGASAEEKVSLPIAIREAKAKWSQLAARAKDFVIDLGRTYGPGTLIGAAKILAEGPAPAVRGETAAYALSKVIEVPIGDNVYGIEVQERETDISFNVAGYKMTQMIPMRLAVQLDSGVELAQAETDHHGYARFTLAKEKLPVDEFALTFTMEDEMWEMLFLRLPEKQLA